MNDDEEDARQAPVPIDEVEAEHIAGRVRLRAAIIYEIVRADGVRELERPLASLFWSGYAAGLSIAFSLAAEGVLRAYLPDTGWRHLVASFGYTTGFLFVVLGRQQLFTENTITAVLPVMSPTGRGQLPLMLRLWAVVLAGNLLGTAVMGGLFAYAPLFEASVHAAMVEVSHEFFTLTATDMFWRGVAAGWLIATMVWLMPAAEQAAFWVVLFITYLIALLGLSHIIAGATEAALLLFLKEVSLGAVLFTFLVPTLIGNVIGGSALFALLSYAQVRHEMLRPHR